MTAPTKTMDGVGVLTRGDVVLILYAADARLHRTRWLFEQLRAFAAGHPQGFLALMVVTPDAAPPDAETRAENNRGMKDLGKNLKRLVTVALGDAFRASIVRTVMRTLVLLQGQSSVHVVAASESEGVAHLLTAATPETPPRSIIESDLATLRTAVQGSQSAAAVA